MLANFDRKWSRSFFSSPKPLKNPIKAKGGFVGLLKKGSITKMERELGKAGNFVQDIWQKDRESLQRFNSNK